MPATVTVAATAVVPLVNNNLHFQFSIELNWLDIIILLPLLIGLVRGLMKGLITEIIAILAVVFGFIGAKLWGQTFSAWILQQFTWPQAVCDAVAYALLFLGISLALHLAGRLVSRLLSAISLGWMNRLLGGAFGIAKWALIVLAVVFCVNKLDTQFRFMKPELKSSSLLYPTAVKYADKALDYLQSASLPDLPSTSLPEIPSSNFQIPSP